MTVEVKNFIMEELQGDMMTPISIFESLSGTSKVLFESSAKHEESGRYSFIAVNPIAQLKGNQEGFVCEMKGSEIQVGKGSVLDKLREMMPLQNRQYPFSFFGGAIGYFGYDTAFYYENIGEVLEDELNMPDVHVYFYDTFIVFDHLLQKVFIAAIDLFHTGRSEEEMKRQSNNLNNKLNKVYPLMKKLPTRFNLNRQWRRNILFIWFKKRRSI